MRRRYAAHTPAAPKSVTTAKAAVPIVRVQLIMERTRRFPSNVESPEVAATIIARHLARADREHFVVLMLNAQNGLLGVHTVAVGTLTACLVSVRDVFKAAILANAASIVVGHNHPSGDPSPSPEDIHLTRELHKAGELLDIHLLDHVVVGARGSYVSLKRLGTLNAHTIEPC